MKNEQNIFLNSRMPLYLQVAKLMRKKIESQEWPFGTQIPTLELLEKEYQVSRITIRGALNELENEGVIRRKRGLGTFVAKDLSKQRWFKLANSFEELVESLANLKVTRLAVDPTENTFIPEFTFGEAVDNYERLRRVHFHNELPYCVLDIYLDKRIYDSDPELFDTEPVISVLAKRADIQIAHARQTLRITVSDEGVARLLDIGVGDPVADVSRVLLDDEMRVFYFAHIQYPAQMIEIETDFLLGASPKKVGEL